MLTPEELKKFEEDGFIIVRRAFSEEVAKGCMDVIWSRLEAEGIWRDDRRTWGRPVVRVFCQEEEPLRKAGTSPVLVEAYSQLLGNIKWDSGKAVSGSFPVRFPSNEDPLDAGWHIDGSFQGEDGFWVNVNSKGRGLLVLFLFTDVGEEDAPTRILKGSHLDIPSYLQSFGETGCNFQKVKPNLNKNTFERERLTATGKSGDVYICHPFLVHAASWPHRGEGPRAIAQAGVAIDGFALRNSGDEAPVERAILRGLGMKVRENA